MATPGATVNGQAADFNIYNLDPYVWFVHKKLGISGYGFSVDDDVSDVGAEKATNLLINFSGLDPLVNKAEWTYGAPYGPVSGQGTGVQGVNGARDRIVLDPGSDKSKLIWNQLGEPDLASGNEGALVNGLGVQVGTRVAKRNLPDLSIEVDRPLGQYGPGTYSFFGPVNATGTIDPVGIPNTISGLAPHVIDQLQKITVNGTIPAGALVVDGPGTLTGLPTTPSIFSLTPTSGPPGSTVVITGTNLGAISGVKFVGADPVHPVSVSSSQITVVVPQGAQTGVIGIGGSNGETTSSGAFTVTPATTQPTISFFTPSSGPVGSQIVITGTNLGSISAVKFQGANAVTPDSVSPTRVTVTVPAGAATGVIGIGGSNGEASSSDPFTVVSASTPTISGFTPGSGTAGSTVVITGTNFLNVTAVAFGGVATTKFTVNSPTQLTVTIPEGAKSGSIGVAAQGGVGVSTSAFIVVVPRTTRVVSVDPNKLTVQVEPALDRNQPKGTFTNQFKFS